MEKEMWEYLESKFAHLDELLELLMISKLSDMFEDNLLSEDIRLWLQKKVEIIKTVMRDDNLLIFVATEEKMSALEILNFVENCYSTFSDEEYINIVFVFKKVHGQKKKAMLERKISFCVEGKEEHIFVR